MEQSEVVSWAPAALPAEMVLGTGLPLAARSALADARGPDWTRSRPEYLLELVCRAAQAPQGGLGLLSAEGDLAEYLTFGIPKPSAWGPARSSFAEALLRFVAGRPGPVNWADFASQGAAFRGRGLPEVPPGFPALGPFLGIPLLCRGRAWGTLYLARSPGAPPFSPVDEEIATPLLGWLDGGSFFDEARVLSQLRLLSQVAQAAAGSLDLPPLLHAALRELDRHLPLHLSVVWLLEDQAGDSGLEGRPSNPGVSSPPSRISSREARLLLAETGAVADERAEKLGLVPGLRLDLEQTPFAACLRGGQALYLDLARPEERSTALTQTLAGRGANSSFAVPLRAGDRAVGILQSICTRPSGFTNEQVQLLYLVADLLGPAISNCQLFGRLRHAYEELRLTQNQLIQAEKMRALGELAGGMAHDFNNSLCGVLGFLELALADQGLTPAVRGYLESARICSLDAAHTVRRVQNFARWQRHEVAVQLLDVNELARQTVALTRHKWESPARGGSPITVEVGTEATARVSGSAAELREVLTNLIFNAVEAMPQGGRLTVRTWSTASDVYLAVADTGVGMTAAVRQRLFEPFFTTKGERGNGLGLSMTFGIIQRHGGDITVDSAPGRGSTFRVRLPLGTPDATAAASPNGRAANHAADGSAPAAPRRSLRILVIEDEESIRRFLAVGLEQLGHHPRLTADAPEGLAAFAEEHFDVVFTDFGLPGPSGEEVARAVARQAPGTPVILLTGWSDQLQDEAHPLEGVAQILGKPVTLNTLATSLAAVGTPVCS